MSVCACVSFLAVAGRWAPVVGILLAALVASLVIPARYSATPGQQRAVFSIVGIPFSAIGLYYIAQGTVNAFAQIAVVGAVYVLTGAVIEAYREFGQARPGVFHAGILMVMLVAGINRRNPYYLYCVCLYGAGLAMMLRSPASGLNCPPPPASRAPAWVPAGLFALVVALSLKIFGAMPVVGNLFFRTFAGSDYAKSVNYLFGADSDLSSIQDLAGSRQIAARVFGPPCLLRGQVLVTYAGARWSAPSRREDRDVIKPEGRLFQFAGPEPSNKVSWRIQPIKVVAGPLPVPAGAWNLRASMDELEMDAFDGLRADNAAPYQVIARGRPGEGRSPRRPRSGSREWREFYLQVPDEIRDGLLEEARKVVGGERDPEALASRLTDYLAAGNYDPGAHHPGNQDPVLHFLRNGLHGHCEYFATSLTLMLRSLGVPARYVIGYRAQERNPYGDYLVVRDRDAHAWVEVYLDGEWQVFDPTPGAEMERTHPDGLITGDIDGLIDGVKMVGGRLWRWLSGLDWTGLGWLLLGLLALGLSWVTVRNLRRRGAQQVSRLEQLGRRSYALLARKGAPRAASETPLELAGRLEEPAASWFRDYSRARFRGADEAEVNRLERELGKLFK